MSDWPGAFKFLLIMIFQKRPGIIINPRDLPNQPVSKFKNQASLKPVTIVKNPPLPKPMSIIKNATQAVVRNVASAIATGSIKIDDIEQARRKSVCESCEHYRASDERCAHSGCGCYLKLKTWLKAEKCPAKKW